MLVDCSAVIDFFDPLDQGPFCSLCTSMRSALKGTIQQTGALGEQQRPKRTPSIDGQKIL